MDSRGKDESWDDQWQVDLRTPSYRAAVGEDGVDDDGDFDVDTDAAMASGANGDGYGSGSGQRMPRGSAISIATGATPQTVRRALEQQALRNAIAEYEETHPSPEIAIQGKDEPGEEEPSGCCRRRRRHPRPSSDKKDLLENEEEKDDSYDPYDGVSPWLTATWLSRATFLWVSPLISKGRKRALQLYDLFPVIPKMSAPEILERFNAEWRKELETKGVEDASVIKALLRTDKKQIVTTFCLIATWLVFFLLTPMFFLRQLSAFSSESSDRTVGFGIFLAVGMMCSDFFRAMFASLYWFSATTLGSQLRSMMYTIVYDKAISLRDLSGYTVGELINLSANDGQRLFDAATFTFFFFASVLMVVIVMIVSSFYIGPAAILGCGLYVLFLPLQAVVAKLSAKLRRAGVKLTDRRVRMMNEIITCIKLIKMYSWEAPFAKRIFAIRKKEQAVLMKTAYIQSFIISFVPVIPVLAGVLSFTLAANTGSALQAKDVFAVAALFNLMRFFVGTIPRAIRAGTESMVGLHRLKQFLLLENRLENFDTPKNPENALEIDGDAEFAWTAIAHKANNMTESKSTQGPSGKGDKPNGMESTKSASSLAKPECKDVTVLRNINLSVKKGELIGICGGVGSGKSSLLSSIVGQLKSKRGNVRVINRMGYVSQQAWIQFQTLRDNVLFNKEFDQELYDKVIDAACLLPDLETLPAGDLTEIGERGINLSGGQKQRVAIARAMYSQRQLYLLDDPLSAVDANVGKRIFDMCIRGIMGGSTVVFVTHQLQYLPFCDRVLFMKDGVIAEEGTYSELVAMNGGFKELLDARRQQEDDTAESEPTVGEVVLQGGEAVPASAAVELTEHSNASAPSQGSVPNGDEKIAVNRSSAKGHTGASGIVSSDEAKDANAATASEPKPSDADRLKQGRLVQNEEREKGAVTRKTYVKYARAGGGVILAALVLLLYILTVSGKIFSDMWLRFWLEAGDGGPDTFNTTIVVNTTASINTTASPAPVTAQVEVTRAPDERGDVSDNDDLWLYSLVYGMSGVFMIVISSLVVFVYNRTVLRASTTLHNRVFDVVVRAPMHFFDSTPTGRIINRFSKDLDEIDTQLPTVLEQLLLNLTMIVMSLGVVAYVFPEFLIACVPILAYYFLLIRYFSPSQREIKRLDNLTRSPLFSHLSATLQGLPTIHAFQSEKTFRSQLERHVDNNTKSFYAFWYASRWFALRLDLVTISLGATTALLVVILRDREGIDPETVGLALLYVTSLGGMFQYTTRLLAEVQARFTSVERISNYVQTVPSEAAFQTDKGTELVEAGWPKQGSIEFKDAWVRYRPHLPFVLKGVSCKIQPNERIGIAGRTGSGKSTMMTTLFRILELEKGSIEIDGCDISTIGLEQLRSKMAIIPQDPVLFVGTVRYNLDPFDEHSDEELWKALEYAHLRDAIAKLPEGLGAEVVENGENFSVGERQLMCLARALLRDSPILLLDEATSAADAKTDKNIQDTIQTCFAGKRTLLVIAHRLDTILDSDRIMVLDQGEVVEFDTPQALLAREDSVFAGMVNSQRQANDAKPDDPTEE